MEATKVKAGFVITNEGTVMVQAPEDNQWGFSLHEEGQSYPGGIGAASSWELIEDDDPRITDDVRDYLEWLLLEGL